MLRMRITPAGAGKTYYNTYGIKCQSGSPPQVRGKPKTGLITDTLGRITPAGAGKTYSHGGRAYCREDHPRRCGENTFDMCTPLFRQGSPPQVRGKHYPAFIDEWNNRITPAGAGKTFLS